MPGGAKRREGDKMGTSKLMYYGLGNGPREVNCYYAEEEEIPQDEIQIVASPQVAGVMKKLLIYTLIILAGFIDLALGLLPLVRVGVWPIFIWAFFNALEFYLITEAALF